MKKSIEEIEDNEVTKEKSCATCENDEYCSGNDSGIFIIKCLQSKQV